MNNINDLKRRIIYRSQHRGTKEMDLLLGKFVEKFLDSFESHDLNDLEKILEIDDDVLFKWYFNEEENILIDSFTVSRKLKKFKI